MTAALVLCGGRGTRLDADVEKPLFEVGGEPMVDRVLASLAGSRVSEALAVVSPHAPATRDHLRDRGVRCVETPGEGYVADLGVALDDPRVGRPVLTAAADLPLLAPAAVDRALDRHDGASLSVCVPVALKEALGVSVDSTFGGDGATADGGGALAPTGLNVVGAGDAETVAVTWDARLAVNVNYSADAAVAESLARPADAAVAKSLAHPAGAAVEESPEGGGRGP